MFDLTVSDHVMIAHSLPDPYFGPAQGVHGSTLVVEATFSRPTLNEHSVVIDIGEATAALSAVLGDLNYRNLDEHPAFTGRLSTTETIAQHIATQLAASLDLTGFAGLAVTLREHPHAWASYRLDL